MRTPAPASSFWLEMPFMRGQEGADRLRHWARAQRQIREQCAARRERVLSHPWAATRLRHICGYGRAEQWNGFVPPTRGPDGELNTSETRREMVELLRDVEKYERENGSPGGADSVDQA